MTTGSGTAWIPWKMQLIATRPGAMSVENSAALSAVPPTPWPIFGNTYANTKTMSRGCMIVRMRNGTTVLRSTCMSRSSRAPNDCSEARRVERNSARPVGMVVAVIRAGPSR